MRALVVAIVAAVVAACAGAPPRHAPSLAEDELGRLVAAATLHARRGEARAAAACRGHPVPPEPALDPALERWLLATDTLARLRERRRELPEGDERRDLGRLHGYLVRAALDLGTSDLDERIGTVLRDTQVTTPRGPMTVAAARDLVATASSPVERRDLVRALQPSSEELARLAGERLTRRRLLLRELTAGDDEAPAGRLHPSAAVAERLLVRSRALYEAVLDTAVTERPELGGSLQAADVPWLAALRTGAEHLPTTDLVARAGATLETMGLALLERPIHIDVGADTSRPRCTGAFALDGPGAALVLVETAGGLGDDAALLHGLGRALQLSHSSALASPIDATVSRAFGHVLEGLAGRPDWLIERGVPAAEAQRLAERYQLSRLLLARRHAARALIAADALTSHPERARGVARERLREAYGVEVDDAMLAFELADTEPLVSSVAQLEGLVLGAALSALVEQRTAPRFWSDPDGGEVLIDLMRRARGHDAHTLAADLFGGWPTEQPLLERVARTYAHSGPALAVSE